jgi:hypothetical protein
MVDAADALNGLRAIHAPANFSEAPVIAAAALAGCLCALALMAWLRVRPLRWRAVRRSALAGLALSRSLDPGERLAAQAALLRRVVRATEGEAPGRLRDGDWLACLDRVFSTSFFTSGAGRAFGEALYRPSSDHDVAALDHALKKFLARIPK